MYRGCVSWRQAVRRKNTAAAGTRREKQTMEVLREQGWFCLDGRASKGPADFVALKQGYRPRLVQVKGNKGNAYKDFVPADRAALAAAAKAAGADAFLVHWPPYGDCRWLPMEGWPA